MGASVSVQCDGWPKDSSGATLTVDLRALQSNYLFVKNYVHPARCAAVLKDDAYGVGMAHVAPALFKAGVREFFVAYSHEGLMLRRILGENVRINVLHEPATHPPSFWHNHKLTPILHSAEQLDVLAREWVQVGKKLSFGVQLNTGMSRLGLSLEELRRFGPLFERDDVCCDRVISHLACAASARSEVNHWQLRQFRAALPSLPQQALKSLAASDGLFLGSDYWFDMVRPGAIFYGMVPASKPEMAKHLKPVIFLRAKILQIHELQAGQALGYDHCWRAPKKSRIAIIAAGYGDGLGWAARHGKAWYRNIPLPFRGRISMDCLAVDITELPEDALGIHQEVDLLNESYGLNEAARTCGCTGYDILTSLSRRYHRRYVG